MARAGPASPPLGALLRPLLAALALCSVSPSLHAQTLDDAFAAIDRGDRRAAAEAFAAIASRDAASDPAAAGSAGNNACMLLRELGDYDRARSSCEAALALRRRGGDRIAIARTLNNYGLVLRDAGEYGSAEAALREALALNRDAGEVEAQAINLGNLGGCAALEGRYDDALALHHEALALASAAAGAPWAAEQERVARVNLGVVLEKLGAFEDALDLYRRVLAGESLGPRSQADLLIDAGTAYRNLGDPVSAESFYRRAAERYRALGDRAGLASAALNLGIAYHLDLARPVEAEAAYREALATAHAIGDAAIETQTLYYLGRLRLERGDAVDAKTLLTRCLEVATAAGSREGRWSCRGALAAVARAEGRDRDALALLEAAVKDVEAVRQAVTDARLRAEYFGDRRGLYAAAVEILFDLDRAEPARGWAKEALRWARSAKERELTEAIGRRSTPVPTERPAPDRSAPASPPLLELFLTERRVMAWLVLGGDATLFDAGPRAEIVAAARDVHRDLASGRAPAGDALRRLSTALLGPIAARLPAAPLLVAPDGELADLPFALLTSGDAAPLIASREVIYVPSAALLDDARSARARPTREKRRLDFAAFADPEPRSAVAETEEATADPRLRQLARLPPLPATAREAAALASSVGGVATLRTGAEATERAVREVAAAGPRILHFATHTVAWSQGGDAAAVVLTPADGDDGLLFPREIAALDLDVDLAVLAACRTNLGWREGGSGVASLTGAFLAAGARSVIATLWDVGDEATAAFMTELYRHLGRGSTPAEALRLAQLRFRSDPRWNDPAIWAAFVVMGDGPVVVTPRIGSRSRIALGAALVLTGALLAVVVWRRRSVSSRR